jgi:hypothetical protein
MHATCSQEVQFQIDRHLDAVERQLQAAGAERSTRRGIVDDLETQILDMLAAKNLEAATPADVGEVLARLDPPEAYSGQTPPVRSSQPVAVARPQLGFCREAGQAWRWHALGFLGLGGWWFEMAVSNNIRSGHFLAEDALPPVWMIMLFVAGAVASSAAAITGLIVGTTLGWISTKRIRTSDGAEYGLPYSVIAALLYPAILIWIITLTSSEWGMVTLYRRDGIRTVNHEYWTMLHAMWIVGASVLSIATIATLMKFSSPKIGTPRSFRVERRLIAAAR